MNNLEELKRQEQLLVERLVEKRKLIGKADSPMESRYPTERFELENSIQLLEIQLRDIRKEIQTTFPVK